jgi:uncharacterized protein YndB with AHSA1/START domain
MTATTEDTELRLVRDFAASQELVYRAWTEPQRLAGWCFPRNFTVPEAEADMREGGGYRSCLRGPDGTDNWVQGRYLELHPFARMVMTHGWENAAGRVDRVTTITLTFEALGPKRTRLVLTQTGLESLASRDGHGAGWSETLDNLERYLAQ